MNRFSSMFRMNLVGWPAAIAWPWGILVAAWLVNVVIWAAMPESARANAQTFGLVSVAIVTMIAFITAMTQLFPFAMGLGATRRAFFLAIAAYAAAQALVFGVMLFLLSLVERSTDGWGVALDFFWFPAFDAGNVVVQPLVYAVPLLLFAVVGMVCGVVHKRWGGNGTMGLLLAFVVAGGALVAWLTWREQWPGFASFFTDQSASALFIGWPLLPIALLLAGGYAVLRRTVP